MWTLIDVCNFITVTTVTTASSANSLSRKGGNVFLFFGILFFDFDFWLPAFLNNHCEHELWKGSFRDIAGSLTLLLHSFLITLFSDKLPKLYKVFVQKQSITCMKTNVHVIYYFFIA